MIRSADQLPIINMRYELSPISVVYTESQMALISLLINLCAVYGGFYTVCSIVDGLILRVFTGDKKKDS
jgi:hypothetical protein